MGIWRSIVRRSTLARGFAASEVVRILLGSREFRRQVATGVIWGRLPVASTARNPVFRMQHRDLASALVARCGGSLTRRLELVALARDLVDADWYAAAQGLDSPRDALAHFLTRGLERGLAPARGFAVARGEGPGANRQHLAPWAGDMLEALGLPVGPLVTPVSVDPGQPGPAPGDVLAAGDPGRGPRVAVVTAAFGRAPQLAPVPRGWAQEAQLFVLTDRPETVPAPWRALRPNFHHHDPRRQIAYYKTHLPVYFQDYDWLLWTDGRPLPGSGPAGLIAGFGPAEIALRRDPACGSVRDAVIAAVRERREPIKALRAHMGRVATRAGFETGGLFDTGLLALRPGSERVQALFGAWWREIANGASADALSLPIVLAEAPDIEVATLPDVARLARRQGRAA